MPSVDNKRKNTEKLSVRDYITMAILLVLVYLVFVVVGTPIGMTVAGNLFIFAACAVIWGTIFLLLYTKIPKKWCVLVFGIILAAIQLMNFWAVSLLILTGALLAELFWQKLDRRKISTMMICFSIQITFWYLGTAIPLIFMKDLLFAAVPRYEELFRNVAELMNGPIFLGSLSATILGCVLGVLLGKVLLKKHFRKAGIV